MELEEIKKKELISLREEKIQTLLNNIFELADGVDIVGDGKHLIHETDFMKISHEFVDGVYIRRMDFEKGSQHDPSLAPTCCQDGPNLCPK